MASAFIAIHNEGFDTNLHVSVPSTVQKPSRQKKTQIPLEQGSVQVVERNSSTLYIIPKDDIYYIPMDAKRLVLCEYFDARDPVQSCRFGNECRWVHADTSRTVRKHIHVNWAWRSLEECKYPTLPAGIKLNIREPPSTNSDIIDTVDSGYVLRTRCVFDDPKRPAAHCAHFYYGRECHLGSLCDFAHVVYIDPNAWFGERAPPPCTFGRGRDANVKLPPQQVHGCLQRSYQSQHCSPGAITQASTSRQSFDHNSMSHDPQAYSTLLSTVPTHTWQEQVQQYSPPDHDDDASNSPCSLKDDDEQMIGEQGDPLQCPNSVNSECISLAPQTPGTPVVVATGKGRWRYNPYGGTSTGDCTPETAGLPTPGCPPFNFSLAGDGSIGQTIVPAAVGQVLAGALSPATVNAIPLRPMGSPAVSLEPLVNTTRTLNSSAPAFQFRGISSEHQLLPSWTH